MAHGIDSSYDFGFFYGKPLWHKHPNFQVIDVPVSGDQVREVFNWEIEKRQNFYLDNDNVYQKNNSFTLVRKDTGHVLADSVGSKFEAESNLKLWDIVENGLLKAFPDLTVEGVATLFSNRTAFIQLKGKEFQVKGDKSPTVNRMVVVNPISFGAYKALVHNERIVCANTLRVAEAEGKANKTLKKFSHLKGAFSKINFQMEDLAEQQLMLERHIESLNMLATVHVNSTDVNNFLKAVFPQSVDMSEVAIKHNLEKRQTILDQFNKDQDLEESARYSQYGLLNALTYVVDHEQLRKDIIKTQYDNIAGSRMDFKAAAFNYFLKAA